MEKVTAVVPSRNSRRLLHRCLTALSAADPVPEIIVVDDGSQDGTAEMLRSRWPAVICLTLPAHTGRAHAVNAGLRLVRTEYAFVIRPDLQPSRSCVKKLLEALRRESGENGFRETEASTEKTGSGEGEVFCAVPGFPRKNEIREPGRAAGRGKREKEARAAGPRSRRDEARNTIAVPDGCALYRMRILEEIGWLDERLYEGLEAFDLCLRAALFGFRTIRVPDAAVRPFQEEKTPSLVQLQIAAGNGKYIFCKNLPAGIRLSLSGLTAAAGSAQAAAFRKRGAPEAGRAAAERGRTLCGLERAGRAAPGLGIPVWPESLPDAAFLAMDERCSRIYPLFLAEKEPFLLRRVPRYLWIRKQLAREAAQILRLLTLA